MKKFFNFETQLTPLLLKVLYPILVVYYLIRHSNQILSTLSFRYSDSIMDTLTSAFLQTVYLLIYPFILRVVFELALALFRLYQNSHKIAHDKELTGVIETMAELKKATAQPKNAFNQQPYNPNMVYGNQPQPNQGFAPNNQPFPSAPQTPVQNQPNFYQAQPNQAPQAMPTQGQPAQGQNPQMPNNQVQQ